MSQVSSGLLSCGSCGLADAADTQPDSWLKYCQAAGFIYRNHYSESKNGSADLKSYLNGKF